MKLQVKSVSKSFINAGVVNKVLEDISFTAEEGEVLTLLGPSGCGKTTILTTIAGFQKQDSGEILLNDKPIKGPGPDKGFVFQSYALFPWMTVEENIMFPMKQLNYEKNRLKDRTEYLLDLARLTKYKDYYPHQISGGMKQRNALVRALALEPEILLMDEPLGALDVEMRNSLQNQLIEIFNALNLTVIIVTHDIEEALYLSDRIILMSTNKGEVIFNERLEFPHPRDKKSKIFEQHADELSELFIEASQRGIKMRSLEQENEEYI